MVMYCAAYGCKNEYDKRKNLLFHSFPFKRPDVLQKWITAVRRDKWMPTKTTKLCSEHFVQADYQIMASGKCRFLKEDAVPSKFNFPEHLKKHVSERRILKRCLPIEDQSMDECSSKRQIMFPEEDAKLATTMYVDASTSPLNIRTKQHSPEKIKLKKRIKVLQQKVRRRNKKITSMKGLIEDLKKRGLSTDNLNSILESYFQDFPLHFIVQQHKNMQKAKQHREYSEAMKEFAQTVYFYSPKAYRFLRETFILPHPRTIRNWLSTFNCNPGFIKEIFDFLKIEREANSYLKYCALIFDAMSIRKQIIWDEKEQKFAGYCDFGGVINCDRETAASEAIMFQIVSYKNNFKCPIAYFVTNKMDAVMQAQLLECCLRKLFEIGIIVKSVTCDGTTTNIQSLNKLGCQLYNNSIVSAFKHPSCQSKVYAILDPCHMLKLARNTFAERRLVSPKGEISWVYLKKLAELQNQEGLKLANSLTFSHVCYKNKIMNVRLATQALSSGVADAIDYLNKSGHSDFQGSEATVEFIRYLDRIFDILNSRNPFGKGFKSPIKPNTLSYFRDIFADTNNYFKSLTIDNIPVLQHNRKTFALGFLVCMNSIWSLVNDLFDSTDEHFKYFLCYKVSQDHLELFLVV